MLLRFSDTGCLCRNKTSIYDNDDINGDDGDNVYDDYEDGSSNDNNNDDEDVSNDGDVTNDYELSIMGTLQ